MSEPIVPRDEIVPRVDERIPAPDPALTPTPLSDPDPTIPRRQAVTPPDSSAVPPIPDDSDELTVDTPPRPDFAPVTAESKEIATLPPIPKPEQLIPISEATGQPRRHPLVVAAVIVGYLSAAATAAMYGWSWWRAVHQDTFLASARLLAWVNPPPGKWLALTLVSALAAYAALMAAAPAIIGFNTWNGHRWTRIGSLVALAITIGGAVMFTDLGWIAVGFAVILTVLVWVPPVATYFTHWERFRAGPPKRPRPTGDVFYGPLPRYR